MRKFLLLLTLLLVVVVGLNTLLAEQHYIVSGEPGDVLYTAAFDGLLDDWQQYTGRLEARVEDQALHIISDTVGGGPFSAANAHFADFDVQAQAQALAGPLDNAYGLIFRLQNKGNDSPSDDNYYLFLVSSDGYYQVRRVLDNDDRELSAWIPSDLVNIGVGPDTEPNWLRVVAQGSHFQFYINGQPVALCVPDDPNGLSTYNDISGECVGGQMLTTLEDTAISSGQVGFIVLSLRESGVHVAFDNLVMTMPQAIE